MQLDEDMDEQVDLAELQRQMELPNYKISVQLSIT